MTIPSLLLSPSETRDRNGPVEPTVSGDVQIVDGQSPGSKAWRFDESGKYLGALLPAGYNTMRGTLLVRVRWLETHDPGVRAAGGMGASSSNRLLIGKDSSNRGRSFLGSSSMTSGASVIDGDWYVMGLRWDGVNVDLLINGSVDISQPYTGSVDTERLALGTWPYSTNLYPGNADIEGALLSPEALSDADIHRISTMPEAWTWEKLLPRIGGVRTVHDPAPFAVRSTHEEI